MLLFQCENKHGREQDLEQALHRSSIEILRIDISSNVCYVMQFVHWIFFNWVLKSKKWQMKALVISLQLNLNHVTVEFMNF